MGLSLSETAFLLTVMAGMEIAGKTYLATVGESVPVAKIHFLIGQSVIMTSISVILIFAENYIAMIFLSIGKRISNLQSIDRKLLAATNTDIYLRQCTYPRCILKTYVFVSSSVSVYCTLLRKVILCVMSWYLFLLWHFGP